MENLEVYMQPQHENELQRRVDSNYRFCAFLVCVGDEGLILS